VLIPFYNEAGNIAPLLDEVHGALAGIDYEVVCVNDCSSDATAAELTAASANHPDRVVVLTHIQRRGKSAALMTGLRSARGDWVQLLDGDGQNDPADARRIWDLIAAKDENPALGIVCGRRTSRNDSGF
jgi:dolichol-phosphate mannosyltransferase